MIQPMLVFTAAPTVIGKISMNVFRFALIVTVLTCQSSFADEQTGEQTKVGDFTLLDHQGVSHQLSWYGDQKAIAILIHANGDTAVHSAVKSLAELRDQLNNNNVTFFLLNPLMQDNRQNIAREAQELAINFPVLVDEAQLVAESLGAKKNC